MSLIAVAVAFPAVGSNFARVLPEPDMRAEVLPPVGCAITTMVSLRAIFQKN